MSRTLELTGGRNRAMGIRPADLYVMITGGPTHNNAEAR